MSADGLFGLFRVGGLLGPLAAGGGGGPSGTWSIAGEGTVAVLDNAATTLGTFPGTLNGEFLLVMTPMCQIDAITVQTQWLGTNSPPGSFGLANFTMQKVPAADTFALVLRSRMNPPVALTWQWRVYKVGP